MAEEQALTGGSRMPPSARARLAWRPVTFSAQKPLAWSIIGRSQAFVTKARRLSAWYEQFASRISPWQGWHPLALEFDTPATQTDSRMARASRPVIAEQTSRNTLRSGENASQQSAYRAPDGEVLNEGVGSSQISSVSSSELPSWSRPAIRLAILRAEQAGAVSSSRSEATRANGADETALEQPRAKAESPVSDLLPQSGNSSRPEIMNTTLLRESRLILNVSPSPRREVRGGFPAAQTRVESRSQAEPTRRARAAQAETGLESFVERGAFRDQTTAADSRASSPDSAGAIERLIERTVMPGPLPGLSMRLIEGENFPPQTESLAPRQDPAKSESDEGARSRLTPPPQPPPQLDVNKVSEKVFETLRRREQSERERKGLY